MVYGVGFRFQSTAHSLFEIEWFRVLNNLARARLKMQVLRVCRTLLSFPNPKP